MTTYRIKRIYEKPSRDDGYRVLVDRLWPRGVSKQEAALDEWAKDIAPSTELRQWFGHRPELFVEFTDRYLAELHGSNALITFKEQMRNHKIVTLLYGARDPKINHATILRNLLLK